MRSAPTYKGGQYRLTIITPQHRIETSHVREEAHNLAQKLPSQKAKRKLVAPQIIPQTNQHRNNLTRVCWNPRPLAPGPLYTGA